MKLRRVCLAIGVVAVSTSTARAADDAADVRVGDIYDRRASDPDKAAMVVELRTTGDIPEDATHFRWHLTAAVDSTGRNLLREEATQQPFTRFSDLGVPVASSAMKFHNPARAALAIAELSGELQLFLPERDPRSAVVFEQVIRRQGHALSSDTLQAAKIEIALLTKDQYDALKEEQEALQAASQDPPGPGEVIAGTLSATFATAFGGFFSSRPIITEESLVFEIHDPQRQLVDIAFRDLEGKGVEVRKWTAQGDLHVCELWDEPTEDSSLIVYLRTEQSLLTIPFHLTDIALP